MSKKKVESKPLAVEITMGNKLRNEMLGLINKRNDLQKQVDEKDFEIKEHVKFLQKEIQKLT